MDFKTEMAERTAQIEQIIKKYVLSVWMLLSCC